MNKTIIIGPQGSGKSTLANKITNGRKSIVVRYEKQMNKNRYWAAGVESDTEVIIIDKMDLTDKRMLDFLTRSEAFLCGVKYKSCITISPDIIILSQSINVKFDDYRFFDVLYLNPPFNRYYYEELSVLNNIKRKIQSLFQ